MIIPAVDLIEGQVVRLYQGNYHKKTVYAHDPSSLFNHWVEQGATQLHLVDLDGAANPSKRQISLIQHILTNVNAKIQVGGGIRTEQDAAALLKAGAQRIVIGSLAVTQPETVRKWFKQWGSDAIVLALDINIKGSEKEVAINGWKDSSHLTLESIIAQYNTTGLKHILCTDISRDGALSGTNTRLYQELTQDYPHIHWQASGGVSDLAHLPALKHSGVNSAIVGRALLEKRFTYAEALQCWQNA